MLLDDTDTQADAAMWALKDQGVRAPITAVVATTFTPGLTRSWEQVVPANGLVAGDLPATVVLHAAYFARLHDYDPSRQEPRATPIRFATPGPARWGRVSAALILLNVHSGEDLHLLPELVAEAWDLNGYHLRLAALDAAHSGARNADEIVVNRLRDVLDGMDVSGNWALSSLLVEALAACGAIEPIATARDLREEIDELLANADDPRFSDRARSLLGHQFEDEAIFGPVTEVVAELGPADLVTLCGLALTNDDPTVSIVRDWAVARIADNFAFATPRERQLIAQIAGAVPADSFVAHEGLNAHLDALRAWATLSEQLPPPSVGTDAGLPQRTWRLVDKLAFSLLRDAQSGGDVGEAGTAGVARASGEVSGVLASPSDIDAVWGELLDLCRPTAVDALVQMSASSGWASDEHSVYALLVDAHPVQVRALFEWGLENWTEVRPATGSHVHADRKTLVHALGRVGDDRTRVLLESHLDDPELSSAVVRAIGAIESRLGA